MRRIPGALVIVWGAGCANPEAWPPREPETLVHSVKSEFSNIRVRDAGGFRSLYFVEPGLEVRQTSMLLDAPERLVAPYTRTMFASMLMHHPQERVLLVGLGGGSMVRFLNHHMPQTRVDAVEIDPQVVKIAADLFGTRPSRRTRIFTEDAFAYLRRDVGRYDAIYMDAFLEPGPDTDPRGIPQRLKTLDFFKGLRQRLNPGGVVAFNLSDRTSARDAETIALAFPSVYVFAVPGTKNFVVIASTDPRRRSRAELAAAGRRLDATYRTGFSFEAMVRNLQRP